MKYKILLADDSSTIQRLVERIFENSDFELTCVSNGGAAVETIPELRPAVVLVDVHMPGKTGYEVCAFVKQDATLSAIPVVLLVGAFEVFDEDEATRAGADRWITKPFEARQLHETVADLVGESKPREEPAPAHGEGEPEAVPAVQTDSARVSSSGPDDDVLGLEELFPRSLTPEARGLSEEEIDAIADRVISRLSSDVVESIAWDIVPEIADRIMRDELKKQE